MKDRGQGDPLYRARRTLRTGAGLLTDAQAERLEALFADERHAAVQAFWGVYQRLIQAYCTEDPGLGKHLMRRLIDSLKQAVLALAHRCILPRTPRPATTSSKTHSHLTHHIRIPNLHRTQQPTSGTLSVMSQGRPVVGTTTGLEALSMISASLLGKSRP